MRRNGTPYGWHCVMLHAAGSSPRALGSLRVILERHGLHVTAPQVPMQVMPDGIAGDMPFAGHVALAKAELGSNTAARRILFGHSFGGLVALLTLMDGVEVDAAVLYEPIVLSVLDDCVAQDRDARRWDRELVDHLARNVAAGDPATGILRFIEAYNEVEWTELPERARAGIVADACNIRDLALAAHHLRLPLGKVSAISTSVLVMHGSRTLDVTRRMAQGLARLLPRSTLATIETGGHMAPALMPEAVGRRMISFLGSIGDAR